MDDYIIKGSHFVGLNKQRLIISQRIQTFPHQSGPRDIANSNIADQL